MAVCAGITYNPPDQDYIKIEHVEGDPDTYSFRDVYDTSEANKWGVVARHSGYYADVYLLFREIWVSGAGTTLNDSNVHVNILSTNGVYGLRRINPAVIDISDSYIYENTRSSVFVSTLQNSTVDSAVRLYFISLENVRVSRCIYIHFGQGCIAKNIVINKAIYGALFFGQPQTLDNLQIINSLHGFWCYFGDVEASGIVFINNKFDFLISPNGDRRCILDDSKCDFDSYKIQANYSGTLDFQLRSTFRVVSGVENCHVKIYNSLGYVISEADFDNDYDAGKVTYLQRFVENAGGVNVQNVKTDYQPFRVEVSKKGYRTITIPDIYVTPGQPTIIRAALEGISYITETLQFEIEEPEELLMNVEETEEIQMIYED